MQEDFLAPKADELIEAVFEDEKEDGAAAAAAAVEGAEPPVDEVDEEVVVSTKSVSAPPPFYSSLSLSSPNKLTTTRHAETAAHILKSLIYSCIWERLVTLLQTLIYSTRIDQTHCLQFLLTWLERRLPTGFEVINLIMRPHSNMRESCCRVICVDKSSP